MPIQDCQIDDKPGKRWGNSGTCYPYEPGNEESKNEAIKKAMAQAVAIGGGEVKEMATLVDVPILRAGKHNSHNAGEIEITEEQLDEILEGSQALAPIVKESFNTGVYRGNEALKLKTMPGFLNLVHDNILADTIKERTKGVNVEYGKKFFENPDTGEQIPWITQTFRNVPQDIAEAIKTRFPKRSVELIPFTNPETGKQYRMAIRSTAFLNNEWRETPPAVKGQDDNLHIEFSQGDNPVLVLFSGDPLTADINKQQQEVAAMAEKDTPETGIVTELQAKIDEQAAELQAYKELHEAEKTERAKLDAKVAELQAKDEKRDIIEFMKDLRGKHITGADGIVYAPSKAFCDMIEPLVSGTRNNAVIELADGQKPARQTLMNLVNDIIELASKDGGMLIALGQIAPGINAPLKDEDKPKSPVELMKQYEKDGLTPSEAWKKANEALYGGK